MFIPNWVGVYGSQSTQAQEPNSDIIRNGEFDDWCYHYKMKITKLRLRALDQSTERCDQFTKHPNTSECIARYIEDQIGCGMNIDGGSTNAKKSPCTLVSELVAMNEIIRELQYANSNTIYRMTGCLASCERNEYGKIEGDFQTLRRRHKDCTADEINGRVNDLHLEFSITAGSYKEEEQYIIYDFNSFFGESGGIVGILIGCSVLSLYQELADLLGRLKPGKMLK